MDMFLFVIKDEIPQSNRVLLQADLNSKCSTWVMTATGPREFVDRTIQIMKDKIRDYKVISISIKDICAFKTEYLRYFHLDDISALEKKYGYYIGIETLKESEALTSQVIKAITIRCFQLNKN